MKNFTYAKDELLGAKPGDIVRVNGARFQVIKKTSTAAAVRPYRWYHAVADWIARKVERR